MLKYLFSSILFVGCGLCAHGQQLPLVYDQEHTGRHFAAPEMPGYDQLPEWRISHQLDSVECLEKTDYHWFLESMRTTFSGDSVYRMPYDHHELCAIICPRALLILGNPDYTWLADRSALVSAKAARKVWQYFGIADRMGYSIVGGHPHCMLPESQYPEVEAFLDKFLLGKPADTDNIQISVLK